MKKKLKMKKFKYKFKPFIFLILIVMLIATISIIKTLTLFKGIETLLRFMVAIDLVLLFLIGLDLTVKVWKTKKAIVFIIFAVFMLSYSGGLLYASTKVRRMYASVANMSEGNTITQISTSIVVLSDSDYKDIKDVRDKKVGLIHDEESKAAYELPLQIIKEQSFKNIVEYDNYVEVLDALFNKKIDAAFLPSSYAIMYNSDEYEDLATTTKIIYTRTEEEEEENQVVQKSVEEPFTILLLGVDTTGNGIGSSFNGDAILLLTVNPKTMNVTILSVPRDTYMPISCLGGRKNKITNAGWQGESCIKKSLEGYFGIKIDYYVKINFNGVVALVDELGGVDIDVPYAFCEQNSKRKWGKNTIFVEKGMQHLNGEQALAFARHRKVTKYQRSYCGSKYTQNAGYWNDFTRGQNQQLVLKAALSKLADSADFSTIEGLLNTLSNNMKTSMSVDTMLSLYNVGKDMISKSDNKDQLLNMQRLYISGKDAYIYDYSYITKKGTKLNLYNFIPYKESIKLVTDTMKENLELIKTTPATKFKFSIQNKYEENVIGKNVKDKSTGLELVPNFVGKNVFEAQTWASSNGISLTINYVKATSSSQKNGQILAQSIKQGTDVEMAGKVMSVDVVGTTYQEPIEQPVVPTPDPTEPTEPTGE